jgi:glycosyltransferase involved in cell wall biosynthesis
MTRTNFSKLSVLIPAYNEEPTLARCVRAVLDQPLPDGLQLEVVLIDDGSHDGTWRIMQQLVAENSGRITAHRNDRNLGKGASIRKAIELMSGDVVIFQDADLEYDPADYPRVLRPILDGRAEVVYGSRFTSGERRVLFFWHCMANKFLTFVSNMLNDTNWTDMETCYKAFASPVLRSIPLTSNRFGIEPEITAKVARNRFRMYEVPISYHGRCYDEGKKIGWRDGIAALWFIVKYRFFTPKNVGDDGGSHDSRTGRGGGDRAGHRRPE